MAGEFDELTRKLKGLPEALIQGSGPELSAALREVITKAIREQRAPQDGTPWEPRKKGTKPMLQGATEAFGVAMIGNTVWVRLTGIEARHHRGWVRGATARPQIFEDDLSPAAVDAISAVLERRFTEEMEP